MEFKVGDRVRIREDLQEDERWDGTWVTNSMLDYRGKMATIKWARDNYYRIDLDDEEFAWVGPFFEKPLKITLEELEKRIEKLEKCVIGEQNKCEKCVNLSNKQNNEQNKQNNSQICENSAKNEEIISKSQLLTEDERVILRNLDKDFMFIARDTNGDLNVFEKCPKKREYFYSSFDWSWGGGSQSINIFPNLFKFIKNSDEPYNIEELLKGEYDNDQ